MFDRLRLLGVGAINGVVNTSAVNTSAVARGSDQSLVTGNLRQLATPHLFAAALTLVGSSGCLVVAPCAGGGQCGSDDSDVSTDGGVSSESASSATSGAETSSVGADSTTDRAGTTSSDDLTNDSAEDSDTGIDGGSGETAPGTSDDDSTTSSDVASNSSAPTTVPSSDDGSSTSGATDAPTTGDANTDDATTDAVSDTSSEVNDSETTVAAASSEVDTSAPVMTTSDGAAISSEPTTTTSEDTEPQGVPVQEIKWQESFEDSIAGWTSEGSSWTADAPTSLAAPAAQSGGRLVGTGLTGAYVREDSRLLSPKFLVPPRYRQPFFRYWYWYQLEPNDTVQVQVRVGDSQTWVDFQTLTDTLSTVAGESGKWLQGILPLSDFGGQEIQLSFALNATGDNCSSPGFFLDNVSLETGPMNVCSCKGFNSGSYVDQYGDWSVEGGQWAAGAPVNAGAPTPPNGDGAAGTNLFGNYASLAAAPAARLASPTIKVAGDGSTKAKLKYWYSFSSAGQGKIQLRVVGEQWQDLPGYTFTGQHETWTSLEIPLNAWADQVVQVGFLIENGGGVETPTTRGFYVDEFAF